MTEFESNFPGGSQLRPARPKRATQRADTGSAGWELTTRVEELHEVVWSIVDAIGEVRDATAAVLRELGRVAAGLKLQEDSSAQLRETIADESAERTTQHAEVLAAVAELREELSRVSESLRNAIAEAAVPPPRRPAAAKPAVKRATKARPAETPAPSEPAPKRRRERQRKDASES